MIKQGWIQPSDYVYHIIVCIQYTGELNMLIPQGRHQHLLLQICVQRAMCAPWMLHLLAAF